MRRLSLAAALALGGCSGGEEPVADQAQAAAPAARNAAAQAVAVQRPVANTAAAGERVSGADRAMALDPQGLRASEAELGTSGTLAFGASADLTVEALTHVIGAAPASDVVTNACGPLPTRVVHWAEGFTLVAREGRFAGWDVDRPGYAFASGIGVGSTLRELGQAFPVSVTRGGADVGFKVNNRDMAVGGTLAGVRGDARILTLHGGITCDPQVQPPAPAPVPAAATTARRR